MRVLVTVGIFPPDIGGPATFVPKIAKYFQDELNYEIEILTLSDNKNSCLLYTSPSPRDRG